MTGPEILVAPELCPVEAKRLSKGFFLSDGLDEFRFVPLTPFWGEVCFGGTGSWPFLEIGGSAPDKGAPIMD